MDNACVHEPDMGSLRIECDGESYYVDVVCKKCGTSGCIARLDTADINW